MSYPSVVSTACWVPFFVCHVLTEILRTSKLRTKNSSPKVLKETCFPNIISRRAAHKTNIFHHFSVPSFSRYFMIFPDHQLQKSWRYSLRPVTVNMGISMPSWFDINSLEPELFKLNPKGLKVRSLRVDGLMDSANYSDRLIWMGGLMGTNPPRQNRGGSPTTCI